MADKTITEVLVTSAELCSGSCDNRIPQHLRDLEEERDRLKQEARRLEDQCLESGEFTRCDSCQRVVHNDDGMGYGESVGAVLFQCNDCTREAAQKGDMGNEQ